MNQQISSMASHLLQCLANRQRSELAKYLLSVVAIVAILKILWAHWCHILSIVSQWTNLLPAETVVNYCLLPVYRSKVGFDWLTLACVTIEPCDWGVLYKEWGVEAWQTELKLKCFVKRYGRQKGTTIMWVFELSLQYYFCDLTSDDWKLCNNLI